MRQNDKNKIAMKKTRSISIVGAGLIGQRHAEAIASTESAHLCSIIDPLEAAKAFADKAGARWFADLGTYLAGEKPDGIIIATPNQMHLENVLATVEAGIPTLVEKPIAADVTSAERMVEAANTAQVPLLVGHHRRHNPLVKTAREIISGGQIGDIVVVNAQCWFFKPAEYFDVDWRGQAGGGPVFINLIHDIDLLRHLCGEIVQVQALQSGDRRNNDVEDSSVAIVRFESGALGTISVSDNVISPWSWELTAKENPSYHPSGQFCYLVGGSHGSLELPANRLWRNPGKRSWHEPVEAQTSTANDKDPLVLQIEHFCKVIAGEEAPLVSGLEGLKTLIVIDALKRSAANDGEVVEISQKQG